MTNFLIWVADQEDVPHFYVDIDDIKKYFKDYNFVKIAIEETEYYNIENTEYFSKHFKLIVSKKIGTVKRC